MRRPDLYRLHPEFIRSAQSRNKQNNGDRSGTGQRTEVKKGRDEVETKSSRRASAATTVRSQLGPKVWSLTIKLWIGSLRLCIRATQTRSVSEKMRSLACQRNKPRFRTGSIGYTMIGLMVLLSRISLSESPESGDRQKPLADQITEYQEAAHDYVQDGICLLELSKNAYFLYKQQDSSEKRKLLNFVCSNSVWKGHTVTATFRQPFDLPAITNTIWQNEKAAGVCSSGLKSRGSAGRTRTYNPSVNSRMLCH